MASERDRLGQPAYKPRGCLSAYYLWHGGDENRRAALKTWIAALEGELAELEKRRGDMGYQLTVNQDRLDALQAKFDPVPDPGQLGAEAFALLSWAVGEIAQGRRVYSANESGKDVLVYGRLKGVKVTPNPLRLDEPLTEAELAHIVKWYEDEVNVPEFAATQDCHVVRAFRELIRLKRGA